MPDEVAKAGACLCSSTPKQQGFVLGVEKLRHDHRISGRQMRGSHAERNRANQVSCGLEIFLPTEARVRLAEQHIEDHCQAWKERLSNGADEQAFLRDPQPET